MKLAIHQMAALSYYSRVQVVLAGLPLPIKGTLVARRVHFYTWTRQEALAFMQLPTSFSSACVNIVTHVDKILNRRIRYKTHPVYCKQLD